MTTVEILRAARAYIVENGWWQGGNDEPPEGPRATCASNACSWVAELAGNRDASAPSQMLLSRLLGDDHEKLSTIFNWNDAPGRTVEDVLALFDRAIDVAVALEQEQSHGRVRPDDAGLIRDRMRVAA